MTRVAVSSLAAASPRLSDFRDRHRGDDIVVCGCGGSLRALAHPERYLTIGVNDVGRLFTPDYLVVVNERRQFAPDRYVHVERSDAQAVFSPFPLDHPRAVRFRLGRRGGTDRRDPERLHYSNNSPYVAVDLARHMGARRIGLVGVDFHDDHFFGATGRHPLSNSLDQVDRDYAAMAAACAGDGIELVNLSPNSRLASLPRMTFDDWDAGGRAGRRVLFVHYRFLSCGTVFETGLREAAEAVGVVAEHACWDDPALAEKVERFAPDLLFVVHGRRFVQRWGRRFARWRTAVWLLDEPYEVDDTASWSSHFDAVFVNDSATLARHRNAHLLPTAYAPSLHRGSPADPRRYRVGFIGGANPTRERFLAGLAARGLLDYVVGGPWQDARLRALCLADNIPAERTAALYRDTAIVVNVFRDRHHFNRDGLAATSLNPRIHEAVACGALVISEPRDAIATLVPELPVFDDAPTAAALIERFLTDDPARLEAQRRCAARLGDATYADRLRTVLDRAFAARSADVPRQPVRQSTPVPVIECGIVAAEAWTHFDDDWDDLGGTVRGAAGGGLVIDPGTFRGPGRERGLASRASFNAVDIEFEARLESGACLLAKVHQADRVDQSSNSYHLFADERQAYLARHHHVFWRVEPPRSAWTRFRLTAADGVIALWRNGRLLHRVRDPVLAGGYAFLGAQGGAVRLRGIRLSATASASSSARVAEARPSDARALRPVAVVAPRLSIVTTIYDRTECLRRCIASVQRLAFGDYEHLIVADHPPPETLATIEAIVADADDPRIGLYDLERRFNNWGIAPAAAGLRRSRGEFVAFLSDDNGYAPTHFDPLVRMLDADATLGFVYSSCLYDGRLVLNHPVPRPGRIDLGQPLFRRALFELYLDNDLPFDMMAWDWHLVDTLMRRGVRWRHVDRRSFIFRLARYPALIAAPLAAQTAA